MERNKILKCPSNYSISLLFDDLLVVQIVWWSCCNFLETKQQILANKTDSTVSFLYLYYKIKKNSQ